MKSFPKETINNGAFILLRNFCLYASNNKNLIMLITAFLYMLGVYGVLSSNLLFISAVCTVLFIICLVKNLFPVKYILVWALIFYFGAANTTIRIKPTDDVLNLAPVNAEISGKILNIPQGLSENKPKFFYKVNSIKFGSVTKTFKDEKVLVTINLNDENPVNLKDLKIYNSLKLTGRLSTPFKAGNPSQFDYGNYLRNHDTYAVFYANEAENIPAKLSSKEKFMQDVNNYRENIIKIHSQYLPSPNLEILGGIVFGDDAVSPPQNIKKSFINSGLLHILAASGMNVAFIYGFFFILMSLFKIEYKVKVILGMLTVAVYTMMTGLGASVIRAAFMLFFVLIGKLMNRDAHSISLLSFVALLMLIYNPLWINDVGFQLSFIVTFGILVMAPAFFNENRYVNYVISAFTIPVIAQLWVIPVQIFYFNNISIYSVFANIMSVPILAVLSFGGFISSLLSAIAPVSNFICQTFDYILNPLITLLINISDFWGKLPNSTMQTSHPAIIQILMYYGLLLSLSVFLYKDLRKKYLKPAVISAVVLFLTLLISTIPVKNTDTEITAFDVGNADCFLIKSPDNKYFMIDTGKSGYNGGKTQAEIIILKYLKDNGIRNLDSLIITHFDDDHCGGAADLINNLKIDKIYVNDLNHESNQAKEIYKAAQERNTTINLVNNNQVVYNNKNGLKIVNFKKYSGKIDNDNSIITLLTYNKFSMLFTGDAGINGINPVLEYMPESITVLKVPHHGAIYGLNREIVNRLKPKYSLVSTGQNKFGHPSLYILKLLENSTILRTDVNNSVRFTVNKNGTKALVYDIKERKYKPLVNR